jgi:hypothetical protein
MWEEAVVAKFDLLAANISGNAEKNQEIVLFETFTS